MFIQKTMCVLFFLPALLTSSFLFASGPNNLQYDIRVKDHLTNGKLDIVLTIAPDGQKSTTLHVPSVWGVSRKWEYLCNVKVQGGTMTVSADSLSIVIAHKPNKKLTLSYTVLNCIKDTMPGEREVYLPAIKPAYLTAFTNSILFAIDDSVHTTTDCTIRFSAFPYDKLYTSFYNGNAAGKEIVLTGVRNEEIQNGVIAAGDYRITEALTNTGQKVTLAIRGNWTFSDSDLYGLIRRTIDQQRNFWNDFSQPTFLITFSPSVAAHSMSSSYTGTGLHNSFAVSCTNNELASVSGLAYLFNHELMHHWIGSTILNAADEELSYWFSEGFTDYFARVNMLESREIDSAGYYQIVDSVFRSHYADDRLTTHNDSIKVHFWDDSYIGKLPYNRGSLFAMLVDCRIRQATAGRSSLKTVMQQMVTEAKSSGPDGKQFNRNWFEQTVKEVSGLEIAGWIDEYIIRGKLIPIDVFNPCMPVKLAEKDCKVFGFGYEEEKDDEGVRRISKIIPGTGASKADFRIGDRVRGYNVYMQPDSDSQVLVERDGKEIWIDFHPYEWRTVPQFVGQEIEEEEE